MRKLKNNELNRLSIDAFKETEKLPVVVVLDNIRSLNNIGSVFRTSDAFLINEILLCGITAKPPHKDIQKTALGATESVDWNYFETTEAAVISLKNRGFILVSVEQVENSVMLNNLHLENNKKYAFVFGNEVKGVQQSIVNMSDFSVEIPQSGTKHSLNISVSVGVVLWHIYNKFL